MQRVVKSGGAGGAISVEVHNTTHHVTLGHTVSELAEPQGVRHVHEDDVVEAARAERHGQRRLAQVNGVHDTSTRVHYE